ncbi:hypothetical protein AB0M39_23230 [Streptomyces sp. NPDC051907]|uniref:hypothetical protein n=1 Tax=Streptomyces sp. NPDC051907 TaxID=3155284 RepID=UPI0034350F87
MTAPLTPPHQPPSNDDPWQSPPTDSVPEYAKGASRGLDPELKKELRDSAVVVAVVTVLGVALGLLWLWLAPRVPLVSNGEAVFLKDTEGEEAVGADGTFALLALGFGAVTAAAVFWWRRRGGVPLVVALAVGGVLGSLLAWGTGVWLGPSQDVEALAREAGVGVAFDAYLKLEAWGVLLAWPVAAMVVHLALTAAFTPRDPDPENLDLR